MFQRLTDFIVLIMTNNCPPAGVSALAREELFNPNEKDTAVYVYGPYHKAEQHPADLVIKFITDNGMKISASWQGTAVTLEANLPGAGWDHENGEYGLGGDWWKKK